MHNNVGHSTRSFGTCVPRVRDAWSVYGGLNGSHATCPIPRAHNEPPATKAKAPISPRCTYAEALLRRENQKCTKDLGPQMHLLICESFGDDSREKSREKPRYHLSTPAPFQSAIPLSKSNFLVEARVFYDYVF